MRFFLLKRQKHHAHDKNNVVAFQGTKDKAHRMVRVKLIRAVHTHVGSKEREYLNYFKREEAFSMPELMIE